MNDYLNKIQRIQELTEKQRIVNEETLRGIREEVNKFISLTGKDDMESIMLFLIQFVGQDSYNQGVEDSLKILRETNQESKEAYINPVIFDADN